tara:strand:+ start:3117 stop:3380 length:264 start_codon:yes stop_codon:yes gene_type:complete
MKIFIYKSIFVAIIVFILFQITFGFMIRNYENKLYNSLSKEKITYFKDKIRLEINKGLEKDRILTPEDAVLFKKFLDKVNTELKNTN